MRNLVKLTFVVMFAFAVAGFAPAEAAYTQVQIADFNTVQFAKNYAAFTKRPGNDLVAFNDRGVTWWRSTPDYELFTGVVSPGNYILFYVNKGGCITSMVVTATSERSAVLMIVGALEAIGVDLKTDENVAKVNYIYNNLHLKDHGTANWVACDFSEVNRRVRFDKGVQHPEIPYVVVMTAYVPAAE